MSERRLLAAAAALLAALAAGAQPAGPTVEELLRLADRPWSAFPEAVVHASVTVLESGSATSTSELEIYRKPPDRSLVEFTAGPQKGRKVLTVGAKVWLIVPGARHAVPVSANQRLMGGVGMVDLAGFRFEGFAATLLEASEEVGGVPCDVLELRREAGAATASSRLWVDRAEHLPRKLLVLLPSGKASREVHFERYAVERGATVPAAMRVVDLLATARRVETVVELSDYRKATLADELFVPPGGTH